MALPEWPEELPALLVGTEYRPVDPNRRSELRDGREFVELASSMVPVEFEARWVFNDAQAQLFEQFHREELHDGRQWFVMNMLVPQGLVPVKCRFLNIYEGRKLIGNPNSKTRHWQYTAPLEMFQRVVVDVLTSKGLYPAFIPYEKTEASAVINSITRRAINKNAPEWIEENQASAAIASISRRSINQFYDYAEKSEASAVITSITRVSVVRYSTYEAPPEDQNEASAVITGITRAQKARYSTMAIKPADESEASAVITSITRVKK